LLPETDARTPHEKKRYNPTTYSGLGGEGKKNDLMSGQPAVLSQLFFSKEPRRTQQKHHKKPAKEKKKGSAALQPQREKTTSGKDRKKTLKNV
jgi:hypothetical protein